ncbi:hypothetical protein L3Y34_014662 [Caenorhabditis briggsae]|uniref:Uncharacterized protein n=1 Tax=Caenorhabditis briggsae TaxID=6238 RepID=A0AAE9DTV6_CAEBR|nr:hypothetical protein L3Y34_014662 [Caenorhabditis briggsae]
MSIIIILDALSFSSLKRRQPANSPLQKVMFHGILIHDSCFKNPEVSVSEGFAVSRARRCWWLSHPGTGFSKKGRVREQEEEASDRKAEKNLMRMG